MHPSQPRPKHGVKSASSKYNIPISGIKNEINRLIKLFSKYNKSSIVMYNDNLKDMQNSQIIILGVVGVLSVIF